MKFYISPSSQEANLYANRTNEEAVMNLIADSLCEKLKAYSPSIEFMRNKKSNTYAGHVLESNTYKPDIHLAIHSNALNGKARGCEVFCYDPNSTTSISTKLAWFLYEKVSALTPTVDRGVKAGTMAEVRSVHAPAVLIEIAFHDNPEDAAWIVSHISDLTNAILSSILYIAKVPYISEPSDDITTLKTAIKLIKNIVSPF